MKRPLIWALALLVPAALYILGAAHGAPRPEYSPSITQRAWLNPITVFHPDEFAYVGIPYRMLLHKDWNPHYYHNPSLNLYTNLGMFALSNAQALPHNADYHDREIAPFALYFSARYFSALYTLLSVVLSYLAGRIAFNRKAGIITAALLGLSPQMVQHAHYATPIAQTTLLATAAVAWAVLLLHNRLPLWAGCAVSGLLVGLAMSARYNAATVGVVSGLAMLAVAWQQRRFLPLMAGAAAVPLGFALGTPGIIFATQEVIDQIQSILEWYKTEGGGPGFTAERGLESFYYHWRYVALVALGPAAVLAAVAGQILTLRRWRNQWQTAWLSLALALYVLAYTALALPGKRLQANLLLPLLLPLALLAGSALATWWDRWPPRYLRVIGLLVVIGWPGLIGLWFTAQISTMDNRLRAQEWIYEHIPRGATIHMLEPYNVPLDPLDYQTKYTFRGEFSAEKVRQSKAQIIVYSDSFPYVVLRDTALSGKEVRAKEIAIKNVLQTEWIELKRFKRMPWPAEKIAPDDVSYWHQMEIIIYCNPSACPVDLSP